MRFVSFISAAVLCLIGLSCRTAQNFQDIQASDAEKRAIAFLAREVPLWFKENNCFSCHNNGDAARALYTASLLGHTISRDVLADTTRWLESPERWDENKGDPAFSDKRLARLQFTVALAQAAATGHAGDRRALSIAAESLLKEQQPNGAWEIDPPDALGSPATYGTPLATAMAANALSALQEQKFRDARRRAKEWFLRGRSANVLEAAAALILVGDSDDADARGAAKRAECLDRIRTSQAASGGWGPYADSPPEPFDTAVVLLGLAKLHEKGQVASLVKSGRDFLHRSQLPDGSWPETTRPALGKSYAQRISTTGWATLALLETREHL